MKEVFNRTLAALYTIIWRILIWILESYFTLIFFRGIKIQIFKNWASPNFRSFSMRLKFLIVQFMISTPNIIVATIQVDGYDGISTI